MILNCTLNDLVKYIYQETSEEESFKIRQALLCDAELYQQYMEMVDIISQLNDVHKSPSQKSIDRILNYSKSRNLHFVQY